MRKPGLAWIVLMMTALPLAAQSVGTIKGKVSEEQGDRPVAGALVRLKDTEWSAVTNEQGEYGPLQVPAGTYRIAYSCAGFGTIVRTDVVVRPGRITFLDVRMREDLPWLEESVTVQESYFQKDPDVPTSALKLSAEEVRRAPGTAGFVERVITALPGVGFHGADENADLLVRGGSPDENGFFIDAIEIPNINHLPRLASTGGVYSAFNPDLLQNVEFTSGAFPADYGDRLSSITNITFREGNRTEIDGELDLNLFMAGTVMDGPLPGGKGSWLISGRKSYLDVLNGLDILSVGKDLDTEDLQVKLALDLSPRHKIGLLDVLAGGSFRDHYGGIGGAEVTEDNHYAQNTLGLSWKAIWSDRFFSNTSLAHSFLRRTDSEAFPLNGGDYRWESRDLARHISLRNSNCLFFGNDNKLEFGTQIKREQDDIHFAISRYIDSKGGVVPPEERNFVYATTKSSFYVSAGVHLSKRWDASVGLRGDYSSAHKSLHLSPRLSASVRLNRKLSVTGGYGIFHQTIPMRFLAFYPKHLALKDAKATHGVLGIEYIAGSMRLRLEAYDKRYRNLLIDPSQPQFLANELAIDTYYYPVSLTDTGTGFARGVELLVHKKLVKDFHALVSLTVATSRYRSLDGVVRNSSFKTPCIINLLAGYKPDPTWEFGVRWTFAGGRPTTPFDLELSRFHGRIYYDLARVNETSFPSYNKLNLRVEKRFLFKRSNLVFYLDIWNALDRKIIYEYEWDSMTRDVIERTHLPRMPIFGLKFEF